jgi:hypothetical protein
VLLVGNGHERLQNSWRSCCVESRNLELKPRGGTAQVGRHEAPSLMEGEMIGGEDKQLLIGEAGRRRKNKYRLPVKPLKALTPTALGVVHDPRYGGEVWNHPELRH